MFGETEAMSINQRCWEEALSVQDLLAPAPPRRTRLAAARARLCRAMAAVPAFVGRCRVHPRGPRWCRSLPGTHHEEGPPTRTSPRDRMESREDIAETDRPLRSLSPEQLSTIAFGLINN